MKRQLQPISDPLIEMKKLKLIGGGVAVAFAILQFINPARTNPPVKNDFLAATAPPARLAALFRCACYDCHSYETKWPWYGHVAPISWGVVGDVNHARSRLALSSWPADNPVRAAGKLQAMGEEIRSGEMPLRKYTLLHPEAKLTTDQRGELADWLSSEAAKIKSPAGNSAASPPTPAEATTSLGRALFLKNCVHCHGADAHGDEGPDLHNLDWTDEQITTRIRNGKKGQMTAFAGKLSADQINELKNYLHTLK